MTKLYIHRIAILPENIFEEFELTSPKKALEAEGATVPNVSPQKDKMKAMKDPEWSIEVPVDKHISTVKAVDYDGLLLPTGVINPDLLRTSEESIKFIQGFFEAGKPVAAICLGPQSLIETEVVEGQESTSYPSL